MCEALAAASSNEKRPPRHCNVSSQFPGNSPLSTRCQEPMHPMNANKPMAWTELSGPARNASNCGVFAYLKTDEPADRDLIAKLFGHLADVLLDADLRILFYKSLIDQ